MAHSSLVKWANLKEEMSKVPEEKVSDTPGVKHYIYSNGLHVTLKTLVKGHTRLVLKIENMKMSSLEFDHSELQSTSVQDLVFGLKSTVPSLYFKGLDNMNLVDIASKVKKEVYYAAHQNLPKPTEEDIKATDDIGLFDNFKYPDYGAEANASFWINSEIHWKTALKQVPYTSNLWGRVDFKHSLQILLERKSTLSENAYWLGGWVLAGLYSAPEYDKHRMMAENTLNLLYAFPALIETKDLKISGHLLIDLVSDIRAGEIHGLMLYVGHPKWADILEIYEFLHDVYWGQLNTHMPQGYAVAVKTLIQLTNNPLRAARNVAARAHRMLDRRLIFNSPYSAEQHEGHVRSCLLEQLQLIAKDFPELHKEL